MTRPYSEDLRERALARFEAGETIRSIGQALGISPSCVSKWRRLKRETGSLLPGQIGGHKPRVRRTAMRSSGYNISCRQRMTVPGRSSRPPLAPVAGSGQPVNSPPR
jgi:transposase-like protein